MRAGKVVAGIDLGGTKIYTALADTTGKILSEVKIPTDAARGPEAVIADIIGTVKTVLESAGIQKKMLGAVGIGTPGPVDYATGIVEDPPNLPGWRKVYLKKILEKELGVPVYVDNDANLAGFAELHYGAAKGLKDVVYVTASTGVGGGLILDGRLYRGINGAAGEVGHMTIVPDGPLCNCGKRGCLEAVGSGTAFFKRFGYTAEEAGARAKAGDKQAVEDVAVVAWYLGIGVANLINIFDPQAVVVGGGLTNLGGLLFDPMRRAAKEHGFSIAGRSAKILKARLGKRIGVMGAIAIALH